jgi:hypothetical protein
MVTLTPRARDVLTREGGRSLRRWRRRDRGEMAGDAVELTREVARANNAHPRAKALNEEEISGQIIAVRDDVPQLTTSDVSVVVEVEG